MNILDRLGKEILFFDGAMGTAIQNVLDLDGQSGEILNIEHPDIIKKIHCDYLDAGCDIITTNTFGANPFKAEYLKYPIEDIISSAIKIAKDAVSGYENRYVAFDLGPTGKLLEPIGPVSFDECYEAFKTVVNIAKEYGVDLFIIETMSDTLEAKAALLAVKENSDLPVFCTMTFDESHKTLTGADVTIMSQMLEGLGADCIGINCGLGPRHISPMIQDLLSVSSIPCMAQPNAGLPEIINGQTQYNVSPKDFAMQCEEMAKQGISILGGCCGTTPDHIQEMVKLCRGYTPKITKNNETIVCSYSRYVKLDDRPVIIGERINPTGKKKFKEALKNNDINYVLNEAIKQAEAGAHILDVNVGLPEICECEMMETVVKAISSTVNLPLQIDSSDVATLERALRIYNGKPMLNSVNGKAESLDKILPIAKKYGAVVVGLCLDDNGIPKTARERFEIAKRIADKAKEYGICKRDLVMDALTLTISAQQTEAAQTITALKMIKDELGIKTVLGVSNISFGLPKREYVTSTFFALALNGGLDACIINPCADSMMNVYRAYRALSCIDENCTDYIEAYTEKEESVEVSHNELYSAILNGLYDASFDIAKEMLKTEAPLDIINSTVIPALNDIGKQFETGKAFLPQLIMSADTVSNAFRAIKEEMNKSGSGAQMREKIVIATVEGDIHDIGKNIVKTLLENYGYEMIDLGKNVPAEDIVRALIENDAHALGLSALMSTTVKGMERTIKLVREANLDVKVFVGGAVLTQEYADMIGADAYCSDALASVNYANKIFGYN
ncbi:MAG: homocysteine S-methyltransferase family protein [Clostridia bacterium]|nr:homocysteine S-methyltransferase family protein [Clostridia bacterium]